MMRYLFVLFLSSVMVGNVYSSEKNHAKEVKRNYSEVYGGIVEFAIRQYPQDRKEQKIVIKEQSKAFYEIAQVLENSDDEKLKKRIKSALLRWHWHWDTPILTCKEPVDWYMAWMECLYPGK